jgi:hypothetical protein
LAQRSSTSVPRLKTDDSRNIQSDARPFLSEYLPWSNTYSVDPYTLQNGA